MEKKAVLKYCLLFGLLFLALLWYVWKFHTYKEEKNAQTIPNQTNFATSDIDGDGIENTEDIVQNARAMKGVLYDQLMGKFNNIGQKLGLLVCIDIPKIAYKKAGIDFEQLLRDDFLAHRSFYDDENGQNTPSTSFFFRRTRNLYAYCRANGKLLQHCDKPKVGDIIFYGKFHVALVVEVHSDGTYNEIENAPWTYCTVEHERKFWKFQDVGRILPSIAH